jgi:DNA-binding CsgD family transcriptional regulator
MKRIKSANYKFQLFTYTAIMLFFVNDILDDFMISNHNNIHFYLELFFVVALIYLLATQFYKFILVNNELSTANDKLTILKKDLHEVIDNQFVAWKLTKAETDVAWFVIKGISFSKIAELRNVSEKTIHQQISSVYKKSDTKNRHEFMSGFLEDFINY